MNKVSEIFSRCEDCGVEIDADTYKRNGVAGLNRNNIRWHRFCDTCSDKRKVSCLKCKEKDYPISMILCAEGYLCTECVSNDDPVVEYETCSAPNCDQCILIEAATWTDEIYTQHDDVRMDNEGNVECPRCTNLLNAESTDRWLKIHFTRLNGKEEAMKVGFVMETLGLTPDEVEDRYDLEETHVESIISLYKHFKEEAEKCQAE